VTFKEPRIPVISNVTAKPFESAAAIPGLLAEQLVSPVQWEATLSVLVGQSQDPQVCSVANYVVKRIHLFRTATGPFLFTNIIYIFLCVVSVNPRPSNLKSKNSFYQFVLFYMFPHAF
jgi:hypothetical protein